MRIAYILSSLRKLGPAIVIFELVSKIVEKGYDVTVFYFDDFQDNILEFPCKTQKIRFWDRIDFKKFDIVHSNTLRPDMYVFLHKPVLKSTTTFVTTIHNFAVKDLINEYNRIVGYVMGNLWMLFLMRHDKRIVLSNTAMTYYSRWFSRKKLVKVYNTRTISTAKMSNGELAELKEFKGDSILLGTNAVLTYRKGVDLLIKALQYNKDWKLFVVGDGKAMKELHSLSEKLNVSSRVFFAGYREDASRYLSYYDLYMMPSRSEGFGLALLEAVALRCNAVVSDIPIFIELFSKEEVTFFKTNNVESLVCAIETALKTDKSEAAYKKYIKEYSPEKFVERYLEVYKTLKR